MERELLCIYCAQLSNENVALVWEAEAGCFVCPSCGQIDPEHTQHYETIGRATDDDSHLFGRTTIYADGLGPLVAPNNFAGGQYKRRRTNNPALGTPAEVSSHTLLSFTSMPC